MTTTTPDPSLQVAEAFDRIVAHREAALKISADVNDAMQTVLAHAASTAHIDLLRECQVAAQQLVAASYEAAGRAYGYREGAAKRAAKSLEPKS